MPREPMESILGLGVQVTEIWMPLLVDKVADLEREIRAEQFRSAALRDALLLFVHAEFGVGTKLDALRALERACK